MTIIFAGTSSFAAIILKALLQSTHPIAAIYTQPDRPAGRGLSLTPSPVKSLALSYALPIYQPRTLNDPAIQKQLREHHADLMIVTAYGIILPKPVLTIPLYGCINVHPSLLPRWRGATPLQHAILAGDPVTGVSIMQMDEGLDTGPVLRQQEYILSGEETAQTLHDQLAYLGAKLLVDTLNTWPESKKTLSDQDETQATFAHKIHKKEALIHWSLPAYQLERMIRAFNPWPIAYTIWQNQILRVWHAQEIKQEDLPPPQQKNHTIAAKPGTIIQASPMGIDVATGEKGILRLLELQLPGKTRTSVMDFYHARYSELNVGTSFLNQFTDNQHKLSMLHKVLK